MKKYLVIGNPIDHSLSPKLHNHWFKINNINAIYEKKKIDEKDIKKIISEVREGEINGLNVTIPFKKAVIPFLDELTPVANEAQSVNTIYLKNDKVIGHNTDISGFELALTKTNKEIHNKKIFILGAGGVVPSILTALKKMKVSKIFISNRTKEKANNLKKTNPKLEVLNWGETPDFDIVINATSLGLKKEDEIKLNYANLGTNKFFYDLIYNPKETKFLKEAKKYGNFAENGKMMFIYQAHQAFYTWHQILPNIDNEVIKLLDND
tara:strand:+ start:594 stop:1391 length:798 start_codon:yes stop_codon:yes gene_type:complete